MDTVSVQTTLRALAIVLLLLLPAAATYAGGHDEIAHYAVLGTVLAFYLGLQARQLTPFGLLIPFVYAAAAITANLTDGVAALIVAVAAATGAASSLGYHRGLIAVLAAVLIGAYEASAAEVVARRSLAMLVGCGYGVVIVRWIALGFTVRTPAVNSRTALGYSLLLAVLVLLAWFTARVADIDEVWWLPLVVATLGEPWLDVSTSRAVTRLVGALAATLVVLMLLEPIMEPALRAACAVVLLLALVLSSRGRVWLHGFLFTPVLMLLASDQRNYASVHYLEGTLLAFGAVAAFTVLGKWLLWTVRPDAGHRSATSKPL